ncbi:hypothetical protein GCM10009555_017760 [Acrocarpospora macrocephala]|uniref:Uncharacterized protein n=1 Tax=Acrocarpospora macrocephala TaxID=150177 RepID=A0A5M3WF56_9ACTN|nr:hypothetical protein [Acrocarpospora macrocephala]GES07436.1 hypothetical protein Amac_010310 [Acrocarpospora macrocephala]
MTTTPARRYQTRPAEPRQVEAVLLTDDNLDAVRDWLKRCGYNAQRAHGQINVLVGLGYQVFRPDDWLINDGKRLWGLNPDDFNTAFEPAAPTSEEGVECR